MPATPGPATAPSCDVTLFRADAEMKFAWSTSCGVMERCAPAPMLKEEEMISCDA